LRAYLGANAQWFIRVGFLAWMILRGLLGGSDTLDAPFGNFLDFGRYLVPLGFLELYLRAKQSASVSRRFAIAGGLVAVTVIMAVGIFGISTFMWLPLVRTIK
jgi:hypothetical protein